MADPTPSPGSRAVFLSYAREDAEAARRLADALRVFSIEVWFDQNELRGGDSWDHKIRTQIRGCALCIPLISATTQSRGEGYFRREWRMAAERTHDMAAGVPFLLPVVIDDTPASSAMVPEEFLHVHWTSLPAGAPTPQFIDEVRRLLANLGRPLPGHGRPSTASAPVPVAPRRRSPLLLAGAAIVAGGAVAYFLLPRDTLPKAPPVPAAEARPAVNARSIAVLPFENMSAEKEANAFFAEGVHEDILTNLSFIRDLHVVSRTTVMGYRGTTKPIRQIGEELHVAYILEGSVRRDGDKVRVTGQLIDARTDEHVWAQAYDRDLHDIFAIQAALAQEIAGALKTVLSPQTKQLLERRPTANPAAYDAYLKARQVRSERYLDRNTTVLSLLEEAVRLDPGFAAAWAQLASRRAFYYFTTEHTPAMLALAKAAMDTAVALAPDDPAVIEGLGDYYYYGYRDYPRATEQYLRLAELRPNDAATFRALGFIQRRQGRFADAIHNQRRGLELDPQNISDAIEFIRSILAVRHYAEAEQVAREQVRQHPADLYLQSMLCLAAFLGRGSTAEMTAFAQRSVTAEEQSTHIYLQQQNAFSGGNWPEFLRLDRLQPHYDGDEDNPVWAQDVTAAEVIAETGDLAGARARITSALPALQAEQTRQPENSALWASLALAHGLLGHRTETLEYARRSAELMPESRDALYAPGNSVVCALAFAWVGEKDRALAELMRMSRIPNAVWVRSVRPSFAPLHGDPRFEAWLSDPASDAPLD